MHSRYRSIPNSGLPIDEAFSSGVHGRMEGDKHSKPLLSSLTRLPDRRNLTSGSKAFDPKGSNATTGLFSGGFRASRVYSRGIRFPKTEHFQKKMKGCSLNPKESANAQKQRKFLDSTHGLFSPKSNTARSPRRLLERSGAELSEWPTDLNDSGLQEKGSRFRA